MCVAIAVFIKLEELPEKTDDILIVFVKVLATISALIFTIPLFFKKSRENITHDKSDEKWVIIYLCVFVLGIFVSLSALFVESDGIKLIFFKLSLVLFLGCLIWLIPYLFLFLKADVLKVIRAIKKSIIDDLDFISSNKEYDEGNLRKKIDNLERIALQVLNNRDYLALNYSITCLRDINHEIMRRIEITAKIGNLLKEIMRAFRDLSVACIECKSDEYSRQIGKHMKELIMNGLREGKNFEYPNLILNIEKLGTEAAKKHLEETTDEILNSLGQIGDLSMKTRDLQRPPILAVLKSLQSISIVCTEEKMVHQCATARTRLLGIARLGKQEGRENIFHEALRRFWVVTAYMYTNIPEIEEANYEFEGKLKKEFGGIFEQTIDEAIEMLHIES